MSTFPEILNLRQTLGSSLRLPVYMDYQATTPMDPRVLEAMLPYFVSKFGNPHSRTHSFGHEAEEGVENARGEVAQLIGAAPKEIIFTSGATESNNLAIKGSARFYTKKPHIIALETEHKCVIDTCRHLQREGIEVTYLPVQKSGLIDLNLLEQSIKDTTLLVSIMAVNNETGVIQPLKEIGQICRKRGVFFHSDIAQAFGKVPIDVEEMCIDLASISGHKIYGPKGIGALYVRRKTPRIRLTPIINGGGQEAGMRSGTVPVPLAVGLGEAARIARVQMREDSAHVRNLYDMFKSLVVAEIPEVFINGDEACRYYGNINLSFACVEGESLILALRDDLAVSSGSACTSVSLESSYVLKSMGVADELAHTSLRFGFGRFTTAKEVEYAAKVLAPCVAKLREISPLWEMMKEGIDLSSIKWAAH